MEPTTVIGAVSALVELFADGADHYTHWKRKRALGNHYCRTAGSSGRRDVITCALSTSLGASGKQIKETYDIGFTILGAEFSMGDATCRDMLCNQLFNLNSRVSHLRRASADSKLTGLLNLSDIIQTSESARISSVRALAELYLRVTESRPDVPRYLPIPKPRSRLDESVSRYPASQTEDNILDGDNEDEDRMTTAMTITTDQTTFQSEPPSPPPTPPAPKPTGSDAASLFAPSEAGASSTGTILLRPKVSVFSMFCPEAMTFQVDLSKRIPETPKRCKCGYRWMPLLPDNKDFIVLKEGFRMSSRFLAKSHSDRNEFACCLCVPMGKTNKYESADALRAHINISHTKWQILHDRDIS
ncbi:hypothetical protein ColTof4_07518 [Colletotrichum tofieldiae]|uniref:Uncharacterized protein n=1 Tax=Colletotrichum tofieldiae TaxID=708197 RepID=A0A166S7B1_9PEZI|nr:hypothetical protein CT0861_07051 [Colletotrichum tofieldiae]GKT65130.1 hypothetical protein ColTof3_12469 [Colletotrichum tofieldiae]GKT75095.1 hypothetical protein ColTof4_07518 [Colletotrichum tofieldiae]GKT92329.1 hypothetical protein Ct61P_10179 [Colletotrichum tofieldiae]